jgi:hypothetical protein
MKLTDQEIDTLVLEVSRDVMGTNMPQPDQVAVFMDDKSLTDAIRYPNDPKKQLVLESIVLGASMPDAFDHLSVDEAYLRSKILVKFLTQFGINI